MLKDKINQDIISALKSKDSALTSLLRMLSSAIKNEEIAKLKRDTGLSDDEVILVLKKEVKKRKDSVEQYTKGSRPELAQKEEQEIQVIQKYLPAEMSEDEVKKIVAGVMAEMGAVSPSQFGLVMKNVMAKTKGLADGGMVSKMVKEVLNKKL